MKSAVITGASGFIGWYVLKELCANGYQCIALVRCPSECEVRWQKEEQLGTNPIFTSYDGVNITDIDTVKEYSKNALFFHFAWDGSAGNERNNAMLQINNVGMTVKGVQLAKELGCRKFIGAGSIMEDDCSFSFEKDNVCVNHYHVSKLTAHYMAYIESERIGIPFAWGKISNAYGVGDVTKRFINMVIEKLINNEDIQLTECNQYYDFIYITDVAKAFRLIGEGGVIVIT